MAEALQRVTEGEGAAPESITCDNGSEFAGRVLEAWAIEHSVQLVFIRPRRPVENGFIESFNGRLRDEFLNVEWLASLEEARRKLAAWRHHYNHQRPHSALRLDGQECGPDFSRPRPIARRQRSRRCTEPKAGASLSPSGIGHSVARVKGSLRRLTSPLTRAAERPKIPAMLLTIINRSGSRVS